MRIPSLLLLCACGASTVEPADKAKDTDAGKPDTDAAVETDTAVVWDTDLQDDSGPDQGGGGTLKDPSVGVTPFDGSWTGTFELLEDSLLTGPNKDPKCVGTFTMTVSGDMPEPRHVAITGTCAEWMPNAVLKPPLGVLYEQVDLIGVGTFPDAGDTTQAVLDLSATAVGLGGKSFDQVKATFDGATFTAKRSIE
ncbi:MAG: hypothetical protein H6732_10500, partial [Alphaproteobacteria bacterium]|nr:hypothetical protein [Alphaproteobacteria bacterium]